MGYDGFLSYSHAADGRFAPALQRGLQRLAKPWNTRRALRIFRDETGLSTNPHLWSAIENALDASEWFVLLASAEAAQSEWVNKEISHWLATKSVDRLLPVVTDGSWEWDPTAGDFTTGSTAVPEAMRGVLTAEPRHLDLRWAREETDLDLRNSRFRDSIADLAAPMHGIDKDELEGEDIRQHRRTLRAVRSAGVILIALLAIAVTASVLAIGAAGRARVARNDADLRSLVAESRALIDENRSTSMLLAVEANDRRDDAASRDSLLRSVATEPRLRATFGPLGGIDDAGVLADGRRVIESHATRFVRVWDRESGKMIRSIAVPGGRVPALAVSPRGDRFAIATPDGSLYVYSASTYQRQGTSIATGMTLASNGAALAFSPDGRWIAVANGSWGDPRRARTQDTVKVFRLADHRQGPPLSGHESNVNVVAFSADSRDACHRRPRQHRCAPRRRDRHDTRHDQHRGDTGEPRARSAAAPAHRRRHGRIGGHRL